MAVSTHDAKSTFVVHSPDNVMTALPVTPNFYQELDERYSSFHGHTLISCHTFSEDWPTWEVHPEGDEYVCLMAGAARLTMRTAEGDESVELIEPGTFVIVPRGTWHTAKISSEATMIFMTPGEGTLNAETPA